MIHEFDEIFELTRTFSVGVATKFDNKYDVQLDNSIIHSSRVFWHSGDDRGIVSLVEGCSVSRQPRNMGS